jgi:hypothetical protein
MKTTLDFDLTVINISIVYNSLSAIEDACGLGSFEQWNCGLHPAVVMDVCPRYSVVCWNCGLHPAGGMDVCPRSSVVC